MLFAESAILFKLDPIGMLLLILPKIVVALLALRAGKYDLDSCSFLSHTVLLPNQYDTLHGRLFCRVEHVYIILKEQCYSMIFATTPEPTVLPPSRIAKRNPSSIAIGVIRVISMSMWSPGMTISTPWGSLMEPVTSVVLK